MSPTLLISIILSLIATMASGNIVQDLFELENENDGAQLLCTLKRNHPGHKDIVMIKDRHGAHSHCNTRFSACDSNINNELSRRFNDVNSELDDELLEFSICQHGQNLVYDHLRGVFTVHGDSSDKRFEEVTAIVQDRNTNKIAMTIKSEQHPTMSKFLLSRQNEGSFGTEQFVRVFHGQIHSNPSLESFFELRI